MSFKIGDVVNVDFAGHKWTSKIIGTELNINDEECYRLEVFIAGLGISNGSIVHPHYLRKVSKLEQALMDLKNEEK